MLRIITLVPLIFVTGLLQANEFRGLEVHDVLGARLITQCEIPGGFRSYTQQASLETESNSNAVYDDDVEYLKLMKTSRGYSLFRGDLKVTDDKYLESSGNNDSSIHLLINRGKGPEHLVFLIDLEGKGEMVWSNDTSTTFTSCAI